jgi:hypothetical protein
MNITREAVHKGKIKNDRAVGFSLPVLVLHTQQSHDCKV